MPVQSILVYVTSDSDNALGENVLKLPLLLALEQAFPAARIAWVPGTSGAFYLRDRLAPLVDGRIAEFITDLAIPTDPRAALFFKHPILARQFDLIVDTQRYLGRTLFLRRVRCRAARRASSISWSASPRRLSGTRLRWRTRSRCRRHCAPAPPRCCRR